MILAGPHSLRTYTCLNCFRPLGTYQCYADRLDMALSLTTKHSPMHLDCATQYAQAASGIRIVIVVKSGPTSPSAEILEILPGIARLKLLRADHIDYWNGEQRATRDEIQAAFDPILAEAIERSQDDDELTELTKTLSRLIHRPDFPKEAAS